jgi:predicted ATPase
MARLDRLGPAKTIAQLGATLGREFSYELLQAVAPVDTTALQHSLQQLVDAELLYQRGLPPQATFSFKHALIQDTAYQSLLKSTRQRYHQQIAQALEEKFSETKEIQPELLAHHYTEAGLMSQAVPYWQKAGEQATQRSAYVEAVAHFTKELELLKTLPDTPERAQQELFLQINLGQTLIATKGFAASEVEQAYARALELYRRVGESPQLFLVLGGLYLFYHGRREYRTTGLELAEQMMRLAQNLQDPGLLLTAHLSLGVNMYWGGEFSSALVHLKQGLSFYDPQRFPLTSHTVDGMYSLLYAAYALWPLGYPDQAFEKVCEALNLAEGLSHPYSLTIALGHIDMFHTFRREWQLARERAEAVITLSTEQGFALWLAQGTIFHGRALAEQGQVEEGIAQMQQGLAAYQNMGAELSRVRCLPMLAAGYAKAGLIDKGLNMLAEALELVDKTDERWNEAELYRLKGELTLQKLSVVSYQLSVPSTQFLTPDPQSEAEVCFLKAIEVAQKQQAKSLELRAVMSLARLRQQQASEDGSRTTQHVPRTRLDEAHKLLSDVYNWFTEGFDTKDLQEAKALIEELNR